MPQCSYAIAFQQSDRSLPVDHLEGSVGAPKGDALLPVLSTLREWGDEWIFRAGNEPLIMTDRAEGEPLALTQVRDAEGNVMSRRDIRARPGPRADEQTKTLFGRGESEST